MRKLIILAAILACSAALPLHSHETQDSEPKVPLQRPSPINPDILSDPRPAEKVVKISDPKEAAKFKREAQLQTNSEPKPLLPTVQPHLHSVEHDSSESHESKEGAEQQAHTNAHHRQKRDQQVATIDDKKPSQGAPKVAVKKDKPEPPKRALRHSDHTTPAPTVNTKTAPAPDTQKQRQRRDVQAPPQVVEPEPLIYRNEGKLPHEQHSMEAHQDHEHIDEAQSTKLVKRDIPVPLVPKYQHPEESLKPDEKQTTDHTKEKETQKHKKNSSESVEKDEDSAESKEHNITHHIPAQYAASQHSDHSHLIDAEHKPTAASTAAPSTEHPALRPKPIPVAELFARPRQ